MLNRHSLKFHEPAPRQPCLCGSGKKFGKCCGTSYETKGRNDAFKKYNEGKYREALRACRLYITWYILCHRAHTIPFLESGTKQSERLLEIDVGALRCLLDLLFACYEKTGKHEEFPSALNSLTTAISDQRWFNRISYQRALWVLVDSDDKKLAFYELSKIENLDSVCDCDILTLYLDLYPGVLSFSKTIKIIDQILSSNPEAAIKLQYTTLKGIHYFLIGDHDRGIELIESGVERFKSSKKGGEVHYENFQLAQALEVLGEFKDDKRLLQEAQSCYQTEIESGVYSSVGTALLSKMLGDSFYASENYSESIRCYQISLGEKDDELTKVFYAKALIQQDLRRAEEILEEIRTDGFTEPEEYDFAVSWALLASKTKKPEHVVKADDLLQGLRPSMPYFVETRDNLLFSLLNIDREEGKGALSKVLKMLRRYSLLQPNVFGLGINLNNIIEDANEKFKRKKNR